MITLEQAKAAVQRMIDASGSVRCVVRRDFETPWGWIFHWNEADVPQDPYERLLGNAPFLVLRETGEYAKFGTAWSQAEQVDALSEFLAPGAERWTFHLTPMDGSDEAWRRLRLAWHEPARLMEEIRRRTPGVVLRGARKSLQLLQSPAESRGFRAEVALEAGRVGRPEPIRGNNLASIVDRVRLWPLPLE